MVKINVKVNRFFPSVFINDITENYWNCVVLGASIIKNINLYSNLMFKSGNPTPRKIYLNQPLVSSDSCCRWVL